MGLENSFHLYVAATLGLMVFIENVVDFPIDLQCS